jgi:DMSO/TMAO reductase YedYZ molybdopterin-dependent catalytic subunit
MPLFLLALCLFTAPDTQIASVKIFGAVPSPVTLTVKDLASLPRTKIQATAHEQTNVFEGVTIRDLLTRAGVPAGESLRSGDLAKTVIVTGADGYRVAFGLAEFDPAFTDRISILADRRDGQPLPENTLPFQLILAGEKRPSRWVRQVVSIEVRPAP